MGLTSFMDVALSILDGITIFACAMSKATLFSLDELIPVENYSLISGREQGTSPAESNDTILVLYSSWYLIWLFLLIECHVGVCRSNNFQWSGVLWMISPNSSWRGSTLFQYWFHLTKNASCNSFVSYSHTSPRMFKSSVNFGILTFITLVFLSTAEHSIPFTQTRKRSASLCVDQA